MLQYLVGKGNIALVIALLLTGCASNPNTETIAKLCSGVDGKETISHNVSSEEELLAKTKRVERLEAKADKLSQRIVSDKYSGALEDKKHHSREELSAAAKELDRLEAEIARTQTRIRAYPRRHFVGARAKHADVAMYMEEWRQKVEKFGNDHYPEAARKNHIYGKVQLSTYIKSDGSIEKAVLERSSGCKILDDHALDIVKNAAPYQPFAKTMKDRFDILSITRTFLYTQEDDTQVFSSPLN